MSGQASVALGTCVWRECGAKKVVVTCEMCDEDYCKLHSVCLKFPDHRRDYLSEVKRNIKVTDPKKVKAALATLRICEGCHIQLRVQFRCERMLAYIETPEGLSEFTSDDRDTWQAISKRVWKGTTYLADKIPGLGDVSTAIKAIDWGAKVAVGGLNITMLLGDNNLTELTNAAGSLMNAKYETTHTSGGEGRERKTSTEFEVKKEDATVGVYYQCLLNNSIRGNNPLHEEELHTGLPPVKLDTVQELLAIAPFATKFAYQTKIVDLQRVLKQQKHVLLFSNLRSQKYKPSWYVAGDLHNKKLIVGIGGTKSTSDVATDIGFTSKSINQFFLENEDAKVSSRSGARTFEADFPDAKAHEGVLKATKYLVEELVTSLKIASRDYEIVVVGHSLGGACAALFACFLNYTLANVRAIAFAPPPCLSKRLCDSLQQSRVVTSVVFRDDLIPRLSFQNAQNLLKNLAESRSDWQHYWQQDKREYLLRAKLGWPPRNRIPREILTSTLPEPTTSSNSSTSMGPEIELKDMSNGSDNVVISQPSAEEVAAGLTWACPKCTFANALPSPKCEICGTNSPSDVVSVAVALPAQPVPVNSNSNANANTSLWGKLTNVVGWGDEASAAAAASEEGKKKPEKTRAKAVAVTAIVSNPALKPATGDTEEEKEAGEPTPNAADDAHADLYLPGAIIHIYVSQCEYKAVYLDPNHDVLTNIQLHKHVIDDHRGKAYVAALQTLVAQTQITTVLQKTIDFKEFTPFDSTAFCECCESDFTWNSTTHSVPQQSADRHNCHNCGRLVCTSCSETHRQLAHLGIAFSLRVCDTCVNGNAIPLFPM